VGVRLRDALPGAVSDMTTNGRDRGPTRPGATTSPTGTPFPVDITEDRPARVIWAALLAGPVVLMTHFMLVYLVAEAGCTGDGHGLDAFDPPVPEVVTVTATAVAAVACVIVARWNYRRWRATIGPTQDTEARWPFGDVDDPEGRGSVAFAGLLLATLGFAGVLLVGVAAPFLPSC
jgi:hypothetical protein